MKVFEQQKQKQKYSNIQLFGWGQSESFQLTINTQKIIPYPVLSPVTFRKYQTLYSKSDYNIIICNGDAYSWGSNLFSRLGIISQEPKVRIPKQILLPTKLKKIGIGNYHAFGISIIGQGYAWGKGNLGQLGIDRYQNQSKPSKVFCNQPIKQVCCGDTHTLVLLQTGKLKSCGSNKYGVLGHNISDKNDKKKRCKSLQLIQKEFSGQIIQITCGKYHNLILTNEGLIYGWGSNENYQVIPIFQPLVQKQQRPSKLLKRSLQIIVNNDQQSIRFNNMIKTNFEVLSNKSPYQNVHIQQYTQALLDWHGRFRAFKQQKQKQQQQLMIELQLILANRSNNK